VVNSNWNKIPLKNEIKAMQPVKEKKDKNTRGKNKKGKKYSLSANYLLIDRIILIVS
jgi:hypothetical protein